MRLLSENFSWEQHERPKQTFRHKNKLPSKVPVWAQRCCHSLPSALYHQLPKCSLVSLWAKYRQFSSVQLVSSVRPGIPVYHQLPEFTQIHVHWVGDAIQPSHPLLSPSPPAPNPSKHQGLFLWINSSHEVAKVLEFQLQHQSFQWIFWTDFL